MNKPLPAAELKALEKQFPVVEKLTRAQKLERFASLIQKHPVGFWLYHRLEYYGDEALAELNVSPNTAFALMTGDDVFKKDGLPENPNMKQVRDYLELTTAELHEFS